MNRFAALPLIPVVLVLGFAGCGGDDAPSKAEFAKEAEKICDDAQKQLRNIGEKAETPDQVAAALDKVIEQSQSSVDDLRELERPDGDAGEAAEKFVNALETDIEDKGIPALEELRDAFKDNDQQAVQEASQKLQAIEGTNTEELAKKAGVSGCE